MARVHVFISGRVQGVYFRDFTRQEAEKLNIKGWVRNLNDGRVEAVFEGPQENLSTMLDWCHKGSPSSRVDNVEILWETHEEQYNKFSITG
ncbi:MAG: acylphosphatase [Peptococcaceae bacterium BRH_c8a]|nr:MAG: acylphosphatase [Peptococcaceae bacterium BRH_c8a]